MAASSPLILELGTLIESWRRAPEVVYLVRELERELAAGAEPFVGRPLPEELVRGRLPQPIASAWVFVLRARTRNPAHAHPNSTQYTAAIEGGGTCYVASEPFRIELFDPLRAERTSLVFQPGTPHAFEPGDEALVVLSFHTAAPDDLIEIEIESGASRRYVAR